MKISLPNTIESKYNITLPAQANLVNSYYFKNYFQSNLKGNFEPKIQLQESSDNEWDVDIDLNEIPNG